MVIVLKGILAVNNHECYVAEGFMVVVATGNCGGIGNSDLEISSA
jgi:hypothetical protein